MNEQTDVKARVVLIVWNLMLTVAVIAMSFRLAKVDSNSVITDIAMLETIEQIHENIGTLADLSEDHSVMIADLFSYVGTLQELALANNQAVINVDKNVTTGIAEIYQSHIIPIRAMLMGNDQLDDLQSDNWWGEYLAYSRGFCAADPHCAIIENGP